jgi:hypothetical protein
VQDTGNLGITIELTWEALKNCTGRMLVLPFCGLDIVRDGRKQDEVKPIKKFKLVKVTVPGQEYQVLLTTLDYRRIQCCGTQTDHVLGSYWEETLPRHEGVMESIYIGQGNGDVLKREVRACHPAHSWTAFPHHLPEVLSGMSYKL